MPHALLLNNVPVDGSSKPDPHHWTLTTMFNCGTVLLGFEPSPFSLPKQL